MNIQSIAVQQHLRMVRSRMQELFLGYDEHELFHGHSAGQSFQFIEIILIRQLPETEAVAKAQFPQIMTMANMEAAPTISSTLSSSMAMPPV